MFFRLLKESEGKDYFCCIKDNQSFSKICDFC